MTQFLHCISWFLHCISWLTLNAPISTLHFLISTLYPLIATLNFALSILFPSIDSIALYSWLSTLSSLWWNQSARDYGAAISSISGTLRGITLLGNRNCMTVRTMCIIALIATYCNYIQFCSLFKQTSTRGCQFIVQSKG